MATRRPDVSITDCIKAFLATRGTSGATLAEIYDAVRRELGDHVPKASIRAMLYKRLVTAQTAYRPAFARIGAGTNSRYRVIPSLKRTARC